jgi:hypothetical protein
MKRLFASFGTWLLPLLTASVAFGVSPVSAASYTYDVNDFSLGTTPSPTDLAGTLNGTITTDTDSGPVGSADIVSYNLTITIGSSNLQITNSNSFVNSTPTGVSVTPTQIFFDFEGNPNAKTLDFTLDSDSEVVLDFNNLFIDAYIPSASLNGDAQVNEQPGLVAIASISAPPIPTTPIPGTLPLFAAGVAVIYRLLRCKRYDVTIASA